MTNDIRGSATAQRLACGSSRGSVRLPNAQDLAAGVAPVVGHSGPMSPAGAAAAVIGSGLFEQIAADMTRLNREIAARATPRPSFEDVLAKSGAKLIAMRGWGL